MTAKAAIRQTLLCWNGTAPATLVPPQPQGNCIPRIIHQIFFLPGSERTPISAIPEPIQRNIEHLRRLNPDWQHRLYDLGAMQDFILEHDGRPVFDYFSRINPAYGAARADLFRYLLLYRMGGVYLDVKSVATRPLSQVILPTDRYLLAHWQNGPGGEHEGFGIHPELSDLPRGEYQQWHLICAPGHPFLRAVLVRVLNNLHRYNRALHGTGLLGVLRTTGPIAYTLAIQPLLGQHPWRGVDAQQDLGFRFSLYGDTRRHHGLFGPHYSQLAEPITSQGTGDRILEEGVRLARALKHRSRGPHAAPATPTGAAPLSAAPPAVISGGSSSPKRVP